MRLFIAINLNDEMKNALIDAQDALREHGIRGRETAPENMHLTLAFIGDYGDPDYVKSVVCSIPVKPFEIKLEGIGAFGDLWWVGVRKCAPLDGVARRLRRALADADVPYDRKKFSPHITILRRASGRLSEAAADKLAAGLAALSGASLTVDHISLMRSDRGKHGMIYTEL